ncbi:uncharacterized protein LOC133928078 [Phragmites australis]|uniref:uncharacterized protein LOC133928078 n=1 Tax=Phragmites australis TaxID=29695 RepID=UPI002D7731C3|nr:uncharacterized protein LOC133928078 [Phragmites australis]
MASTLALDNTTNGALSTAIAPVVQSLALTAAAHLPLVLNMQDSNYTMGSTFFLTLYGKFKPLPHDDYTVKSWMYGSIATDLLAAVMEPNKLTRDLWTCLESQFRDNMEACAIYLNSEFHSMVQGTVSITDYFQKMKTLVDTLCDVGHLVSDSTLVLNTLCGLSPRFSNATTHIF